MVDLIAELDKAKKDRKAERQALALIDKPWRFASKRERAYLIACREAIACRNAEIQLLTELIKNGHDSDRIDRLSGTVYENLKDLAYQQKALNRRRRFKFATTKEAHKESIREVNQRIAATWAQAEILQRVKGK